MWIKSDTGKLFNIDNATRIEYVPAEQYQRREPAGTWITDVTGSGYLISRENRMSDLTAAIAATATIIEL